MCTIRTKMEINRLMEGKIIVIGHSTKQLNVVNLGVRTIYSLNPVINEANL